MSASEDVYPRLVRGQWVSTPLEHLLAYTIGARDPYVAVPKKLLIRASQFRECSARRTFDHDEDGPMPPIEAICRREQGHDAAGLDHIRKHSNGYYEWSP